MSNKDIAEIIHKIDIILEEKAIDNIAQKKCSLEYSHDLHYALSLIFYLSHITAINSNTIDVEAIELKALTYAYKLTMT